MLNRLQYSVNITFICAGKAPNSRDLLYFHICHPAVVCTEPTVSLLGTPVLVGTRSFQPQEADSIEAEMSSEFYLPRLVRSLSLSPWPRAPGRLGSRSSGRSQERFRPLSCGRGQVVGHLRACQMEGSLHAIGMRLGRDGTQGEFDKG